MAPRLTRRRFSTGLLALVSLAAVGRSAASYAQAPGPALVGDGATNDLPVLQTMLRELEVKGRGVLRLPPGRFLLAPGPDRNVLTLPANVRLEGSGSDKTVLAMAADSWGHVINAPYGWVEIRDIAVDGNAANRIGRVGHNIRVNGDNIVVERVRVANSVSYGIAIGQKRFARNVVIRDVEIEQAGADGIDIKNDLDRTENIVIENVIVRGFGIPDPHFPPDLIGTHRDRLRTQAGVDLRGKCEVRGLKILGLLPGRDGLRFRQDTKGKYLSGAHGSKASRVTVQGLNGELQGVGIAVVARDVQLEDIGISDTMYGITIGASNMSLTGGQIARSLHAALFARSTPHGSPETINIQSVRFINQKDFMLADVDLAKFSRCNFTECLGKIEDGLASNPHVVLHGCHFDASCR